MRKDVDARQRRLITMYAHAVQCVRVTQTPAQISPKMMSTMIHDNAQNDAPARCA